MELIFVTNARLSQTEDGSIYGIHTSLSYQTFQHYLKVYNKVWIVARVEKTPGKEYRADAKINLEGVDVLPIPYFVGPVAYLTKSGLVKKQLKEYLNRDVAVICRIPGTLGRLAINILKGMKKPFGVEVAGDPYDVFAPGSFKHPLRPVFRYQGYYMLKWDVRKASAALYVTEKTLQQRYPVADGVFHTYASNVILPNEAFAEAPKQLSAKQEYTVISIGSLDQMYKAPDVLLQAVKMLNDKGLRVNLVWVGDGKYKAEMQTLATSLGLTDKATFAGVIKPASNVRAYLDKADLFVLASRTEGLPRAMVEAMARGLPTVGTNVGGIPELLDKEYLAPINDATALAAKIEMVLKDPQKANSHAAANLKSAQGYSYDILNGRRVQFYYKIKDLTAQYAKSKR